MHRRALVGECEMYKEGTACVGGGGEENGRMRYGET